MQEISIEKKEIESYIKALVVNNRQSVEEYIQKIIASRPFGNHKFYIYSFLKNNPDNCLQKIHYHQPRLTKPQPQLNTSLYRVNPSKPEEVEVFWILPNREAIKNFKKGKIHENPIIHEFIEKYVKDKNSLWKKEEDDLTDDQIKEIYKNIYKYGYC